MSQAPGYQQQAWNGLVPHMHKHIAARLFRRMSVRKHVPDKHPLQHLR